MVDIFKIAIVFVVILVFLRLKWDIGYVLVIASCMLFLLYLVPAPKIVTTIKTTITDAVTIKLFFALTLIRMFEIILREKQVLARMTDASRHLLKEKRAVIVSMPMLIGLLPSLGGAYFSAPMVDETTKDLNMPPEEKGFINYWFRHPWELILPLYPGVLLASALTGIELRGFILANMPYALLIVLTGFLFSMRNIKGRFAKTEMAVPLAKENGHDNYSGQRNSSDLMSFFPLAAVLLLVIVFHIELHYSLGLTVFSIVLFYRLRVAEVIKVIRYGFALNVIVMIFGVMLFKFAMEGSGAVTQLNRYFSESGIPVISVLFVLPFITGLLTGLTVGFVGSTFPLLISLAGVHLNQMLFAFAAGYIGVLLSPVHLCLVLTREYFRADMWGIYKKTLPSCGILFVAAVIEYLLLG
ncbi:MAG: DUF401 family protein [Nitrospirota bacterium]